MSIEELDHAEHITIGGKRACLQLSLSRDDVTFDLRHVVGMK